MMQFWSRPSTELESLENILSGDDAAAGANEHSCKQANLETEKLGNAFQPR